MDSDNDVLLIGLSLEEEEDLHKDKEKSKSKRKRRKRKKEVNIDSMEPMEPMESDYRDYEPTSKLTELANWIVEMKNEKMIGIIEEIIDNMLENEQCNACKCKAGEKLHPGSKIVTSLVAKISDNVSYIPCQLFNRNNGCTEEITHESTISLKTKLHCCALCWYKGKVINLSHSAKTCPFSSYWNEFAGMSDNEIEAFVGENMASDSIEQVSVETQTVQFKPINFHSISTSEASENEIEAKVASSKKNEEEFDLVANMANLGIITMDESTQTVKRKILRKRKKSRRPEAKKKTTKDEEEEEEEGMKKSIKTDEKVEEEKEEEEEEEDIEEKMRRLSSHRSRPTKRANVAIQQDEIANSPSPQQHESPQQPESPQPEIVDLTD